MALVYKKMLRSKCPVETKCHKLLLKHNADTKLVIEGNSKILEIVFKLIVTIYFF